MEERDTKAKETILQKEFSVIYLVILGIILIVSVSLWGAISFGYIKNPFSQFLNNKEVTQFIATPQPSPKIILPESTDSAKPNKDLKIQILNGSGIRGQAGELKAQLEDLGYKDIETGNAEERNNKITYVKFGKNMSSEDKKELIEEMEGIFAEVESEDEVELKYDVVITTGSYK